MRSNHIFKVTLADYDHLDVEMSGKLDNEHMEKALDETVNKSEGKLHRKMLYDVVDCKLPSLGAIKLEISRFPAMLGFTNKFDAVAVLTDKRWLKIISEIEGALYPGLKIMAFSREQKAEVEA